MRLTRQQLLGELSTLEAQHRATSAVATKALAEVARLTKDNERLSAVVEAQRSHPALVENIRLAHDLEQCEYQRDEALTALHNALGTIEDLMRRFPEAFPEEGAA